MVRGTDAIHAQHLAGQVKPGDLFLSFIADHIGFQGARAHGIHRIKSVCGTKQVLAAFQWAASVDNTIQLIQLCRGHCQGQANGAEAAVVAGNMMRHGQTPVDRCVKRHS